MSQKLRSLGFIGAGKLGKAMIKGANTAGIALKVLARSPHKIEPLKTDLSLEIFDTQNRQDFVRNTSVFVLATKPHDAISALQALCLDLETAQSHATIVSVCAGLSLQDLRSSVPEKFAPQIQRVMVNTAASQNQSISALALGDLRDAANEARALQFLQILGTAISIPEDQMDGFTTLTASGPAYILKALRGFESRAKSWGFENSDTRLMLKGVLQGLLAKLAEELSIDQLIKEIATPGGMTEAGLESLDSTQWVQSLETALTCVKEKSQKLR